MLKTFKYRKSRILYIIPCFAIISTFFVAFQAFQAEYKGDENRISYGQGSRRLLQASNGSSLFQCIPSGFSSFPGDFFTQKERLRGGVMIHILFVAYICAMIAIVCEDYFIPSLDIISEKLHLPSDIAGATFMAIGTSAPELFSSITGTFITEGDIGAGTIIGSAVFNILGVTGLVGIVLWDQVLKIEWYPIARDCTVYSLTIAILIWIISDNIVLWWESLILLIAFFLYIVIIYFNSTIEISAKKWASKISSNCNCCGANNEERAPLLGQQVLGPEIIDSQEKQNVPSEHDSFSVEFSTSKNRSALAKENDKEVDELSFSENQHSEGTLCSAPSGGPWSYVWWILMYPSSVLFFITIPDCTSERMYKWYPITFLMSVIWIGVLSYLAVWMVTIIGYTFSIPDSVSGLTILAAGTSVPEIMSSIIVAKCGLGNMAISNLVGSNTFDISFCLGAPWLLKTLLSEEGYLLVYSSALTYSTATLLLTLAAFVIVFQLWHWKLNRTVGLIYFSIYIIFVIIASLYETNAIGKINLPTCDTE